jgi:hypothetical protein
MKPSMRIIIFAIVSSIILFVVGLSTWSSFFTLMLPIVGDTKYFDTSFDTPFRNSMLFSLTLALIPIATILIWRYGPVINTQRKFLTVCIILIAMATSALVRHEMIKSKARNLQPITILDYSDPANPTHKTIESGIPVDTLNFELFVLAGLITGSIISFLTLRQKTINLSTVADVP